MMKAPEFVEVEFCQVPCFAAHRSAFRGDCDVDLGFFSLSTSLLLKKCFAAPMIDFAFLILTSISVSLFRRGVMKEPRYLNLLSKRG